MQNVLVFVEHKDGVTRRVSFELATQARAIADALGGKAHALVVGAGSQSLAETLKTYPLDTIHISEDADVNKYLLDPTIDYLEAAAKAVGPCVIMLPNTLAGRDIAGRIAARLRAGLTSDVTNVMFADGTVSSLSPKLGGTTITSCRYKNSEYGVMTVRPNSFEAVAAGDGATIAPIEKPAGKTYHMVVESEAEEVSGELGLEEAAAVVAGGRGMGGPEPFKDLLKPLADALGGTVGASRAAADAGWVPYSLQIGQTGKTISPNLYIGVGISGAIQHKVGMRTAGTIVAINKDGSVPIADFADLMVVGDLFAIVPELTKALRSTVHA